MANFNVAMENVLTRFFSVIPNRIGKKKKLVNYLFTIPIIIFSVKTIFFVYSSDGSDESACSVDEDPNASPKCNQAECILPDCFCSADGTQVPGNLEITQVPQMITLSFNGAINQDNIPIYQDLFPEGM